MYIFFVFRFSEEMVLCLLNLLKCHLVLAIKDKAVGDLLGEESKEIRKLLIKLIDLPLSDKLQQVGSIQNTINTISYTAM